MLTLVVKVMATYTYCILFSCVLLYYCCNVYTLEDGRFRFARQAELKGSSCVGGNSTTANVTGTCTSLYKCTSAAQVYINAKGGVEVDWPIVYGCGRQQANGDPMVCCVDCELDQNERLKGSVLLDSGTVTSGAKSKAAKKCAEYYGTLPYNGRKPGKFATFPYWNTNNSCIGFGLNAFTYGIGGHDAQANEFPHMALLGYGPNRESALWLCAGSIISDRYILSAAHCSTVQKLGNVSFAGLGILKRSDLNDYWRIYKIKNMIIHPEYKSPSKYHDIMLLETDVKINFLKSVMPACLDVGMASDEVLSATGWGRLSERGELADHLQVMSLRYYKEKDCSELFPPHRLFTTGYNHTTQMCYGRKDKIVNTCRGDSGGPLQYTFVSGYNHILGITSFGRDCGIPGNAGVYTRVRYYVPWIENIVWADN